MRKSGDVDDVGYSSIRRGFLIYGDAVRFSRSGCPRVFGVRILFMIYELCLYELYI